MILLWILLIVGFFFLVVKLKNNKSKLLLGVIGILLVAIMGVKMMNPVQSILKGKYFKSLSGIVSLLFPPTDLYEPILEQNVVTDKEYVWKLKHRYIGTYGVEVQGDVIDNTKNNDISFDIYLYDEDKKLVKKDEILKPLIEIVKPKKSFIYATYQVDEANVIDKEISLRIKINNNAKELDKQIEGSVIVSRLSSE